MKKSLRYLFALVGLALLHSIVLYAVSILAFMGSFGAPQGGDVPGYAEQLARRAPYDHFLQRILDFLEAVLSWPGRVVSPLLAPGSLAWIATSLFWAAVVLCSIVLISRPFKPKSPDAPHESLEQSGS